MHFFSFCNKFPPRKVAQTAETSGKWNRLFFFVKSNTKLGSDKHKA